MAILRILTGVNPGKTFDLNDPETVLGRDTFCDVPIPSRTVSRQHARIIKQPEGFFVEDLESINGTLINGRRIDRRVRLDNRDQIRIHEVVLQFEETSDEDAADAEQQAANTSTTIIDEFSKTETVDDAEFLPVTDGSQSASQTDNRVPDTNLRGNIAADSSDVARSDVDHKQDNPWIKLHAVMELTKNLGSSLSQQVVLPRILDCLFQIFPQTDHGYVIQASDDDEQLDLVAVKHRDPGADTISPFRDQVVRHVMSERTAYLSSSTTSEPGDLDEQNPARSVMCAALLGLSETPLGVIHIETNDARQPYLQRDLDMLVSVGNLSGRAAEAARLHETILALDRRKRELAMARDVQLHFLPQQRPSLPGYSFYDFYRAADQVAGDYYDYIELPDGRLGIAIGDVAGKGVSAALLIARLCSEVRYCLLATPTAADAIQMLNRQLWEQLVGDRFVTLVLLLLDPKHHHLTIVNAGHTPPLRRRGGDVKLLGESIVGIPLGVDQNTTFLQYETTLDCGDLVVLFTDGMNEAVNSDGQLYGYKHLRDVVAQTNPEPVLAGHALVADVRAFAKGVPQNDDICLVCLAREP